MRNSDRRPWSVGDIGIRLVILSLAAIILMALQVTGRLASVQSVMTQITSPAQLGATGATNVVVDWIDFFVGLGRLRVRNAELEELNKTLVAENFRLSEVERENQALRELLDFAITQPSLEMRGAQIVARVLGQDSVNFQNFILLDLGSEQGIAEGMPVVTNLGLVGRITEVNRTTSKVLLISDPTSGVNATLSSARVNGVIKGVPGGSLIMDYIPQDVVVAVGEDILTSGLTSEIGGGRFPKGIPVGQVAEVIQSDEQVSQQAVVIPAIDFAKLDLVLVITNYAPQEGLPEILLPGSGAVETPANGSSDVESSPTEGADVEPTVEPAEQN